jgi:hypothetical protein
MKDFMPKLFKVSNDSEGAGGFPVYTINDGKFYRTMEHPLGWSESPDFIIENDGKLYRTEFHPDGESRKPDYEFRNGQNLYRTEHHPNGISDYPDYVICD